MPHGVGILARLRRVYDARDFGVHGDGVSDDTAPIQSVIDRAASNGGGKVLLRRPPKIYTAASLTMRSGVALELEEGAVIRAPGGLGTHQMVLRIHDVEDVEVAGGVIDGNRDAQGTGEYRHGISIRGSTSVTLRGVTARACAGDGFYIGSTRRQRYSRNVLLEDCVADGNRRQGLSLISGRNVSILRARLTNTGGTAPQAGLDIEPNEPTEFLEEIRIVDLYTEANAGGGVLLALHQLGPDSTPVDIEIRGHTSIADSSGMRTALMPRPAVGGILIHSPVYRRPGRHGFVARNWSADGPRIELIRPMVIDPNEVGTSSQRYGSAIAAYKSGDDPARPAVIGNLYIREPEVRDTRGKPRVSWAFYLRNDVDRSGMARVTLDSPRALEGVRPGRELLGGQGVTVLDPRNALRRR